MQAEAAEAIARLVAQPTDDVDEGSEWNEDDDEQEEDDDGT
jgi:hypothetical protein